MPFYATSKKGEAFLKLKVCCKHFGMTSHEIGRDEKYLQIFVRTCCDLSQV